MSVSDAKRRADKKWRAKAIKQYVFDFHRDNDSDIIEAFDESDNRSKLVKDSVREHLAREKEEQQ